MAGEWVPFGELFAEPPRNGLTRPKAVRGIGVKMVNMGELFAHPRLKNTPMERVPLNESEAQRFLLRPGDLLFARQSLVLEGAGKCSIFLGDDEPVTFESHITRVRLDSNKADSAFYFYYLNSHHGRAAIASIVEQGAGAAGIRGRDLEHLNVLWHNLPEQRAIAHILGTLDDKIELNRRMSQTLEAMARALFKSWFVDFEPVRAKMEGRWQRGNPLPPLPEGVGRGEGSLPTNSHARHPSDLLAFASELRQNETDAERLLWRLLRNRSLAGAKFRRQHPFPPYVLDFYCHELKLAIELDGGQHNLPEGRLHDKVRTAKLAEHGIRVLRFWNHEVLRDTESVLEAIYQAIVERQEELRPSPPAPLPAGEGSMVSGLPAHLYDLFPDRLVDSELGEIPEGWRVGRLGEYIENFDSKRVPLSSREREKLRGIYPYYGAAGVVDYVNDYLFDDIYVLVGEDGLVVTESGHAITQYVWGKFWVNNHAHVLQGRHPVSTEQLYLYFAFESVAPYVTGAVQPKLSQGRMNTMPFLFAGEKVCLEFQRLIEPWFTTYRKCSGESRTLAALRDALLPKLIRGEIRVKDAERFLKERGL